MNKGLLASIVAGTIFISGMVSPFIVQADENKGQPLNRPGIQQSHVDPDQAAQKLSDVFRVSKEDVLKYTQSGVHYRDLYRASFLAKAGGKSLQEVMQAKTATNSWKDVAQALGITREAMKSTRWDIAATNMETKLSIAKQTSMKFLQQGYHPRDIAVANELAKNTNKPIADVLGLKKINNTWSEVATSLGIDQNIFKQDMSHVKTAFPHRGHHHKQVQ
ncbi:hypothetical protein [Sporomusa acidovorans]|uniref:Uncharacterized protein n=1 Tax=Sporomusa acidovorans (strain ATCC 49682 / DSM 3132 / Mol) TaxID=1123286 RepID=A0ABZ3J7A3_SPOA4|nr:hypothetical protein [Sporomusa acidovorans]OZC21036.1 hypothetical protein SPACI_21780 [Sporomusa acidovorans DSM 3132]SDF17805.1 hypothetical protein SAMN04488499_103627 [Sporomusa acidovorans]